MKALKEKYLAYFPVRSTDKEALREVIKGLVELGVSRDTLTTWAIQAGYSGAYVRSYLSRIFCALGLRERRVGAGRKTSPEALELLAYARNRYGDRFLKVLRAAGRAGKERMDAESLESDPCETFSLIVVPQLGNSGVTHDICPAVFELIVVPQLGNPGVNGSIRFGESDNVRPQERLLKSLT
jgi:hypothetical protein